MSVFPALDDVGNYAEITRRERVYLTLAALQFAVNQVLASFQRHDPNWSHIREAEVDVSLVKPDYILAGNIDPKASVADTVELVDFKSQPKLDVNDPKDHDKLDQYRRQLEV